MEKKWYSLSSLREHCEEYLGMVSNTFDTDLILFIWLKENFMIVPLNVKRGSPIFDRYVRAWLNCGSYRYWFKSACPLFDMFKRY